MSESRDREAHRSGSEAERSRELWERLRAATTEAKTLAATNRRLSAEVSNLEARLAPADRTGSEVAGTLPSMVEHLLASAQEIASELVAAAQARSIMIVEQTNERATGEIQRAESQATAILRRAAEEAVRTVNAAKAKEQSILREARARGVTVLSEMQKESRAVEEHVRYLRSCHEDLATKYEVVERAVREARVALREAGAGRDDRDPTAAHGPSATVEQDFRYHRAPPSPRQA